MTMNIGQLMRGLLSDVQAGDSKALELKVGQIVRGELCRRWITTRPSFDQWNAGAGSAGDGLAIWPVYASASAAAIRKRDTRVENG